MFFLGGLCFGLGSGDRECLDVVHNDGLTVHGREEHVDREIGVVFASGFCCFLW